MKTLELFTPQTANRTLPLVKNIVNDILTVGRRIHKLSPEQGASASGSSEVINLLSELRDNISELENLGCFYKDFNFSLGLVDFPAVIDDNEVFLCWRSDEPEIKYYHSINGGYAARRRIPQHYLERV